MARVTARTAAAGLAVGMLGLVGCADEQPVVQDDEPGWRVGLESQPTRAVVDGGRVFVTTAGSARFPPQVVVLDARTGVPLEQRTATGQPYDLLVAPDGRLWVAGDRHPDQAGGAGINVHDPVSLVVGEHADLSGPAYALEQVGAMVWVGSDGQVLVVDAATLELVRSFPVGGPVYDLLALPGGDVLAVEGSRLERLAPDGTVVGVREVEADGAVSVAVRGDELWLRVPVVTDAVVAVLDAALGEAPRPVGIDLDSAGGGVVVSSSGDVLLVDDRRDDVRCVRPDAGSATLAVAADLAVGLAALPDGTTLVATASGLVAVDLGC